MTNQENVLLFSLEIEKLSKEKKLNYIDSILEYCEQFGLEVELVPKLLSEPLRIKIRSEAEKLHVIPKSTTKKLVF